MILLFISIFSFSVFSQDRNIYTVFLNVVNEDFNLPLVGFVNIGRGNQNNLQAGFVNSSLGNLNGVQIGFANIVAHDTRGAQIGFANTARRLNGLQFGFVNVVDEVESGVPIGFLSIVRQGGFRAIELSVSEFHLANVGFKIGVERFYTTISLAYNPFGNSTSERFATGLGIGTIIPINDSFFFNPEMTGLTSWGRDHKQLTSFVPYFGYNLNERFSITAAPSVTWSSSSRNGDLLEPMVSIANFDIDNRNEIVIGARVAIRYRF